MKNMYKPGRAHKYNPSTECGTKPPAKPGEYWIRDQCGNRIYQGETCCLPRRMREHIKTGKLPVGGTIEYKVADGRSTSRTRRMHEQMKIAQHKPLLNKSVGGEGRPAGR